MVAADNSADQHQPDPSRSHNAKSLNQPPIVLPVYRPSDTRPTHDDLKLAQQGIHSYESKRLKLYTDIDPEIAKTLPAYIDAAYTAWENYFGPLLPDREGADFQITGYIMADEELFRKTGLFPLTLPPFPNGRHRGAEFWIYDQKTDYYRRHLMIHEATHCFMTTVRDVLIAPWYLEGMAELFGTHSTDAKGKTHFGVMPHNKQDFRGLGRITLIQVGIKEDRFHSLSEVIGLSGDDYLSNDAYAWSWALCRFLDSHPRYQTRFRKLGEHQSPSAFKNGFREAFQPDIAEMKTQWCLFAHSLQDGFDMEQSAIDFVSGKPLDPQTKSDSFSIDSRRGWQSGKIRVEQGREYNVIATGSFTLADEPRPWISEPQGISIRYFQGHPLGMLLAAIHDETSEGILQAGTKHDSMLRVIPIGHKRRFKAEFSGTIYFRINDSFSELADNTGTVHITIEEVQP
ncbi:MAG: hypothetical protein IID46_04555 [Planctomycetes bacterium]|nr:hypothetical protein [Planctomycetota bacterium]